VSKYIITMPNSILQAPTIREYDEDEVRNHLRDTLEDEIRDELKGELQDALDSREMDLDNLVSEAEDTINDAKGYLDSAIEKLNEITSETAFQVEDNI